MVLVAIPLLGVLVPLFRHYILYLLSSLGIEFEPIMIPSHHGSLPRTRVLVRIVNRSHRAALHPQVRLLQLYIGRPTES